MKTKDLKIMKNISGRELKPGELVTDKEVAPIQVIEGEEVKTKEKVKIEIVEIKRPICQTCQSPKIMSRKGWMCYCDYTKLIKLKDEAHKKELEEVNAKFCKITDWKYHCVACGRLKEEYWFIDTDEAAEDASGNQLDFCDCE
jgi:RNase P subunit RPR2